MLYIYTLFTIVKKFKPSFNIWLKGMWYTTLVDQKVQKGFERFPKHYSFFVNKV